MVFPLGSHLADVPQARRCRGQRLPVSRIRPHAVRDARAALSAGADRPAQHDQVPAQARRAARPRSRALHRAREAHDDQAALGSVALGHAGFLRHRELRASSRTKPTRAACAISSKTRWACPARFAVSRSAGREDRQRGDPQAMREKPPLVLFGSFNERMYMAEVGGARRSTSRPPFPARSSAATPARRSWAMPARPISCRKSATRCSTRCSTSCRSAPSMDKVGRDAGAPAPRAGLGRRGAERCSTRMVEAQPVLVRISAAKRLRDAAERSRARAPAKRASRAERVARAIAREARRHERACATRSRSLSASDRAWSSAIDFAGPPRPQLRCRAGARSHASCPCRQLNGDVA